MTASEIINLIREIEASAPVDQWTIDGVHAWPLIRIQLGMDLFATRESTVVKRPLVSHVLKRAADLVWSLVAFTVANWIDRRAMAATQRESQAIFLSDGVSFTALEGKYYERFCDPVRSYFDSIGIRSLILTPLHRFLVPRFSPSKFIQPRLDWIQIKHAIFRRNREYPEHLPGFELLLQTVKREAPTVVPNIGRIRYHVALAIEFSRYFEGLLDRVRPRVCFLVSYYWLVGYGLLLACKRKGIPSVDIQHGVQGPMHFAYGGWSKVPPVGYELLPTYFWCWSLDEADVIRQWTEATNGAHRPIVGGNLLLNLWKSKVPSFASRFDNRISEKTMMYGSDKQVLVTLQPGLLTDEFIRILQAAITTTESSLQWWLRLHPGMLEERDNVRDMFLRFKNVDIDMATDLPLYALLRHMAVHLTHSSSTVLEAREFGVKSVVCSRYGMELFGDQEKEGIVMYAGSKEELLPAIHKQRGFRSVMAEVAVQGAEQVKAGHRLLDELLTHGSQPGRVSV